MKGADIFEYINQDFKDGIEGINIFGVPKSGKSNIARRINKDCMIKHKENLIMPGTVNCEWRNLLYHKDKPVKDYAVLLPKGFEFEYYNITKDIEDHIKYVDFSKIELKDYLNEQDQFLLVIYDNHFRDIYFYKRIEIWNEVAKQLIDRTFQIERPIGLCFDEAGVYFPQIAIGEHFREVYRFSNLTVDFRKNNIRFMGISQLDSEILYTIRNKQYWTILKKGVYSKRIPKKVSRVTPFYAVDQYVILEGGIYTRDNRVLKMQESDKIMKIIPQSDYIEPPKESKRDRKVLDQRDKSIIALYDLIKKSDKKDKMTIRRIGEIVGLSKSVVGEIIKKDNDKKVVLPS